MFLISFLKKSSPKKTLSLIISLFFSAINSKTFGLIVEILTKHSLIKDLLTKEKDCLSEKDKNVPKNILNKEQLLNKLLELSLHIEEFDILSKSVFREIKETLIFMKYEKEVLEIESFLERYEFDNAKDICDRIIEQIKG